MTLLMLGSFTKTAEQYGCTPEAIMHLAKREAERNESFAKLWAERKAYADNIETTRGLFYGIGVPAVAELLREREVRVVNSYAAKMAQQVVDYDAKPAQIEVTMTAQAVEATTDAREVLAALGIGARDDDAETD